MLPPSADPQPDAPCSYQLRFQQSNVTTLTDGVAGSLRDAVTRANARAGADTVVFASGLAGTITLTGGELDITDDLAVNGPGADRLTVSGNNTSRVFKVESGETVRLSCLTIAGGNAGLGNGGGLANEGGGTAAVRHSTFTSNSAILSGGGLNNEPGGLLTQFDNQSINDQSPGVFP